MNDYDYSIFWNEIIRQMNEDEIISVPEYNMWFKNLEFLGNTESSITIKVPSKYFMTQIKQKYNDLIKNKFLELSGIVVDIEFEIVKPKIESSPVNNASSTVSVISKEQNEDKELSPHPQLVKEYTFDNFVIGDNNDFATSAAKSIADNPGERYNPCLIYGGVGLGKTHLMQSIGNHIYNKGDNKVIVYINSNSFVQEFTSSFQSEKRNSFINKYKNIDVLLLDDIHDLQNKPSTQAVLFDTFNALYDLKKQMVFTCDRPASELRNFMERLKNRFSRGLNVDLQSPKYETRYAILTKKLENTNVDISDDVLDYISRNVTTNIRDLEACLTTLTAYSELIGKKITMDIALKQLKNSFMEPLKPNLTINLIQKKVAEYFNVTTVDLKSKKRTKSITFPRQIAMYLSRELTDFALTEIGLEFGGKDHTTVMHACQKIEDLLKTDYSLENNLNEITRSIKE